MRGAGAEETLTPKTIVLGNPYTIMIHSQYNTQKKSSLRKSNRLIVCPQEIRPYHTIAGYNGGYNRELTPSVPHGG
jgi:hypothetical protein